MCVLAPLTGHQFETRSHETCCQVGNIGVAKMTSHARISSEPGLERARISPTRCTPFCGTIQ